MKFNWGKGLILAYAVFIAGVIIMVTISISKDVELVTPNYYEREIKYQEEIDRINNTNKLPEQVKFDVSESLLILSFPAVSYGGAINGEISFYRPSDSKKDFKVNINAGSDFKQAIDIRSIEKGLWKIKMFWNMNGKDYLSTNSIVKQ